MKRCTKRTLLAVGAVWLTLGSTGLAQDYGEISPEALPPPTGVAPQMAPAAGAAPGAPDTGAAVRRLFAIIKSEPSVRDVQRWALKHYKLEPERIHGMVKSARLKGLLPEVEGGFEASNGENFSNTRDGLYPILPDLPENPNPNNFKERVRGEQANNAFHVRVVFNLERLIFNAEALDAKSLNSLGENLVREVTTLYFSRRRLLAGVIMQPPESDMELFYELTRLDELTATLDALTGGKFAGRAWNWNKDKKLAKKSGK